MLLMPLRSDFGEINRVIGCTSGQGELFAPPLSFAIEEVTVTPVEPGAGAEPKTAVPGFAEAPAEFAGPAAAPKLRTIEGNPNAQTRRSIIPRFRVIDGK